jgi:outer membrane protein OmpA-like peptidoglycan-associated protein
MPDTGMPNMTEADAPAKPASSKGSAVTAVFMILGLSACLAVLVFQVWQWREEAREGLEALRATLVMNGERSRSAGFSGSLDAARDAQNVARNVVDLIKIELPPILAVAPRGGAEPASELVLHRTIPFAKVGSEGSPEIRRMISEIRGELQRLTAGRTCAIAVDGHTDTRGSEAANLELSEKRAQFVAEAIKAEFGATTVTATGWGERRLKVMTTDAVDELENRRVEVTLTCPPPATRAAMAR